jgi:Na+/proline symporter
LTILATTKLLQTTDHVVIGVYLVGIIVAGSLFARGQKTSDDYFVASRRMHWFPLALSIWASLTSANSMLGAPSYGYSQDLQYVPLVLIGLLTAVIVIYLILPILHGLQLTTAYTYLERRYSLPVRCLGSLLFMLLRGGWLASVIYVPSLALSAVIPIPLLDDLLEPIAEGLGISGSTVFWIAVVGVGATIYTTLGGLKAVIWTDVAQFFVFVIGMGAIWFMLLSDLGLGTFTRELGHVPRAYAGEDRQVGWGETVELDGSLSREFQGLSLSYRWKQMGLKDGEAGVVLEGINTTKARFSAPEKPDDDTDKLTLSFALRVTTSGEPALQSPLTPSAIVQITTTDWDKVDQKALSETAPPASLERPHDKWFDFKWGFVFGAGVNFWLLLSSNLTGRINDAGTDQVALQRYFSASSLKESQRAIWVNAICDVPLMPLLYVTGAGVLVYYAIHHNPNLPSDTAQVMPYFVAHKLNELIPGLSGLFIAALFAATMSSIDSGINSLSAAIVTDWYRRLFVRNRDERHYLGVSKLVTLALGLLATFAALFLGEIGEAWQIVVGLMQFWIGPLLGIFLLGFFTRRANSIGVVVGALIGLACTTIFSMNDGNEFFYAIVGLIPALVVGYAVSLLTTPPTPEQIENLTVWTRRK